MYLDPDFRNKPKTDTFCVRCQKDIKNPSQAVKVSVNWETWETTLGGQYLIGYDCYKQICEHEGEHKNGTCLDCGAEV